MSPLSRIVAALLLATAGGHAIAQSATFRVSVYVLPERAATDVKERLTDLPMPPRAQVLPPTATAKRLLYGGRPEEARRFYEETLPQLGFHQARQSADGAVWERSDVRAELRFYPVVGGQDATGIFVTISPMG